jgi:hypothetical protein
VYWRPAGGFGIGDRDRAAVLDGRGREVEGEVVAVEVVEANASGKSSHIFADQMRIG